MRTYSKTVLMLAGLVVGGHSTAYAQTTNIFDVAVVTGTLVVVGTTTVKNALEMANSSITLTGANGYIVASSTIFASTFSAVPGSGAGVMLRANDNSGTGAGGGVALLAGQGGTGNSGGRIDITAGNSSVGPGGDVNITGGTGGNRGGNINIRAGDETIDSFHLAGDVYITGGNGAGLGNAPGQILLNPGTDGAGNFASVEILANAPLLLTGAAGKVTAGSSVNASGFFGTSAILDQQFTVATSTLVVNAGRVGIATAMPVLPLDVNGAAQFGAGPTRSTFSATPGGAIYALNLSSGVQLAAGGIYLNAGGFVRWADGTTSTTASSGGGVGIAILTATQTFSGVNTFTSNVIFNGAVYGAWVEVASAAVSAVTSYTFGSSVVQSSAAYKIEWNIIQNTSNGYPELQVNGVTTGYRYAWRQICDNTDGSTYLSTNDTFAPLTGLSFCATNTPCEGEAIVTQTYPTGRIYIRGETASINTNVCDQSGVATLSPAVGLNAIKFQTSAGSATGTLKLYRRWDK